MTSTSINPIQIQQTTIEPNQPLTLKQGQVFHGTIKKLYPDQMAEVQVGQHKLFAKLETPLKAFDSHFFQVTNINPQTELKLVTGPMQQSKTSVQQLNQLLETMNLSKTSEMQQIVAHFVKNQLPLSKETLIQAENWLKNLPESVTKQDALQVIQKMTEMKMPLSNEIFKGFIYGSKVTGMSGSITNFANLLAKDSNVEPSVKSNILSQLQLISKPLSSQTGSLILSKVLQSLMNNTEPVGTKPQLLNLLKTADVLPINATIENWLSQSLQQHKEVPNESMNQTASQLIENILKAKPVDAPQILKQVQSFISDQKSLSTEQKNLLQQLVDRFEALPKNTTTMELFAKQLHEQLVKTFSVESSRILTNDRLSFSNKEQLLSLLKPDVNNAQAALLNLVKVTGDSNVPVVQNMLLETEAEVLSTLDGKMMEQALRTVLKGLGMSYEATLNSNAPNIQELAHSLKPQILSLIQGSQASQSLREAADNILSRLNGMQLNSGENGHQHQLVMQIPLQFLGKQTEATIQWNGRMKENGKMDANFARVLFYLDMEAIEETVVDMQVQNRIITINLYNNHPQLELLAKTLEETLKKGLSEKKYQLSGLFVKPFEKTTTPLNVTDDLNKKSDKLKRNGGVDIRI